jgi:cell division protein ZapA
MNEKRHSVKVTIVGQDFTIRSDATPEHTRAVADYVDKAIRAVTNGGAVVESHKAAILAALQITDELFKARARNEVVGESLTSLNSEIRRWLPPAKRGAV